MESSKPQWPTRWRGTVLQTSSDATLIHPTARVGDWVVILKGNYVTRARGPRTQGAPRPTWTLETEGKRAGRRDQKKNRRILTTVKAMKPFGEVSILGRLTQPI